MTTNTFAVKLLSETGEEKEVIIPSFRFMDMDLMYLLSATNETDVHQIVEDISNRPHKLYEKGDVYGYVHDVLAPFVQIEPEQGLRAATLFHQTTGKNLFPEHLVFNEH